MTALDPWAGIAPEPKPLTRGDLVLAAAHAEHQRGLDDGAEYLAWADLPTRVRDQYVGCALAILDSAFPLVESEEELDALPVGTLIVSADGRAYRKAAESGLTATSGTTVGTLEVWEQPGERETGRKVHRLTSAALAAQGTWTVVWQVAA